MTRKIVNLPASVHSRLLNMANSEGQAFIDFLVLFANERFLYRLSQTAYAEKFVLKGAMAILNLGMAHPRYTRDIDFSGILELNIRDIEKIMREICEMPVVDDGLIFDSTSITCDQIKAHDQYPGVRVRLLARLGKSEAHLQVDIGVGDVVYPPAEPAQFSGLLDFPQTTIRCYRPETILAEKIHALVKLGAINSRMKDIYDIWQIASQTKLEGNVFAKALRGTFEQRQTDFPESLVIFSSSYIHQRREAAWKAIGKRLSSVDHLPGLPKTLGQLALFLLPILDALYQHQDFNQRWDPAKGWAWH